MRFSHLPVAAMPRPAPVFGQDNHDVLHELGYGDSEIQAMTEAELLGDAPFGLPRKA
jgi:crotonobetainyl-CoA:carnitine CoA-transferase CaiB-like acyl-CoA transferase